MKLLLERAYELHGEIGISIGNADIQTAFDKLHPREADKALSEWGQHPGVTAAIMNESVDGITELEGIREKCHVSSCLRQGTIEAGRIVTACILSAIAPLISRWEEAVYGVQIDGNCTVALLVYADNCYIIRSSELQVLTMMQQIGDVII